MASRKSSQQYPKLAYKRSVPDEVKAVLSKLTPEPQSSGKKTKDTHDIAVSRDLFEKLSKATAQDTTDASSVFQLLPDVELAEQILVGSILSPKDMTNVELGITVDEGLFDSEVVRPLLQVIEDHFKRDYKIDDRLDGMLEEMLFTKGAHILAVLPENNLDQIINGRERLSVENYHRAVSRIQANKALGFLGHPRESRVAMESFRDRGRSAHQIIGQLQGGRKSVDITVPGLEVTDNFDMLKTPNVSERGRKTAIGKLLGRHTTSMESASKGMTPEEIDALYNRPRHDAQTTHTVIPQEYMDRPSVGHPLIMKLPIEAVIPVHVPGQPEEHIGYFVMIDQNGRPVVRDEERDYYGELRTNFSANNQDNTSELVRKTKEAMGGVQPDGDMEFDQIQEAYSKIIENDLINRLRNGIYQEAFELGATEEIYRIMLWRSLQAQQTQLLYIPAELMTYMAFDYNRWGVGQTLLTQSKILSSMRSVLMFAETMSGVRNAVGRKRANINVDPDDPDPQKTISDIQAAVLESGHRGFPLGSPDPGQTLDYLNRAGFDFSINVEGDNYPSTKVEFDDYTTQQQGGNPDLQDRLRRMHISSFGLSPELVDPTQSPDFATSVVNNNLIMTRRVIRYQKRFTRQLTRFIQTYTQHSSLLRQRLLEALKNSKSTLAKEHKNLSEDELLDEFIGALNASLPEPDTTKIDQQLQSFEQYTNLLDRALEAYITQDMFSPELLTREPDLVNHVISVIRAYYQRMWLERNNVMPELDQLTEMDGKKHNFNLLDIQKGQFDSLGEALQEYLNGIADKRKAWTKKYGEPDDEPVFGGGEPSGPQGLGIDSATDGWNTPNPSEETPEEEALDDESATESTDDVWGDDTNTGEGDDSATEEDEKQ